MPYFYRFFIEKYKETVIRLESDEKNESGLRVSHKDSGGVLAQIDLKSQKVGPFVSYRFFAIIFVTKVSNSIF